MFLGLFYENVIFTYLKSVNTSIKNYTFGLEMVDEDLEKGGNICVANKDTGEKCYNKRLPSSLYCRDHITNKPYGLPE